MTTWTFVLIPLLLHLGSAVADEGKITLTGRVIDAQGKPVAGALITAHPPLPRGDLVVFNEADGTGRFRFETVSSTPAILYITSPLPNDAYLPITPPFDRRLKEMSRSFRGTEVRFKKNETIDLGDVRVQVRYMRVLLYLQNPDGEPLIGTREAWEDVWIRIKDIRQRIISESGLSRKDLRSIHLDQATMPLALPQGVWLVEASLSGAEGPWFSSTSKLVIDRSERPPTITIKVGALSK